MVSDTGDTPARTWSPRSRMSDAQPGVAKNHVLRPKDLCSTLRQDKKLLKYDFPKIENSGEQASEVHEKPLHVMVIIFSSISNN